MWNFQVIVAFLAGLGALVYYLRKYFQGTQYENIGILLPNRVVLVTGGASGIGRETALELARRGATVYITSRDLHKGEKARKDIERRTSNRNVRCRQLDLASLASVRAFAKGFLAEEPKLDILINNACIMENSYSRTKDGHELHIGVNHLGHFMLTNLLLDAVKAAAPSRIVTLSSSTHRWTTLNQSDLMSEEGAAMPKMHAYNQSKLANILFNRQLATLLSDTGVTANCVDPGLVWSPAIDRLLGHYVWWFALFLKSSKSGAQTTIAAALDPKLRCVSGQYMAECVVAQESAAAKDDAAARWLWRTSELLTGLPEVSLEDEKTRF